MITTSEIAPSPLLTPYIRCYSYREFDTYGRDFFKPWHACHEISMPFFFKAVPVKLVDPATGTILKTGKHHGVVGLPTQYNGEMCFNGSYAFFQITFRPNGFHKIFGIPAGEINNKIFWSDEVLDSGINILYEQLCEADGLTAMTAIAEEYLIKYLKKQKAFLEKDAITYSTDFIIKNAGRVNVDKLAYITNMSIRNFERHFNAALGLSPKLFCCITRFNHALKLKLKHPEMEWGFIASRSGYFDQTHLIKDFKKFCGAAPKFFINRTPLITENYISRAVH